MKKIDNKSFQESVNALTVQSEIVNKTTKQLVEMKDDISKILNQNQANKDQLNQLERSLKQINCELNATPNVGPTLGVDALADLLTEVDDKTMMKSEKYKQIVSVDVPESMNWNQYQAGFKSYAEENGINLSTNSIRNLMSKSEMISFQHEIQKQYGMQRKPHCDKYDYFLASFSGLICGLIDAFFVGGFSEGERGKLSLWTDAQTDNVVSKFGNFIYGIDKSNGTLVKNKRQKPNNVAGWIGYLEERFKVPYDARYAKDLGLSNSEISMTPKNHHLKSVPHSPDIIGLFLQF